VKKSKLASKDSIGELLHRHRRIDGVAAVAQTGGAEATALRIGADREAAPAMPADDGRRPKPVR